MADISHILPVKVDLVSERIKCIGGLVLGYADEAADVFTVALYKNGTAVSDLETATGYFIRPDGTTVAIAGLVDGNLISVTLPAECYDYKGGFTLAIKAGSTAGEDNTTTTVLILEGRVVITRTDATADPGSIFSFDDIWTAIDGKIDEPSSEGTSGQALLTDGSGGRYWGSAASSGATGSLIVDGVTYSLRTGTTGAANYITLVPES